MPDKQPQIERCPFCDAPLTLSRLDSPIADVYFCDNLGCPHLPPYSIRIPHGTSRVIAAHNQLCEYVKMGKLVEEVKKEPPEVKQQGATGLDGYDLSYNDGVRAVLDRFPNPERSEGLTPAEGEPPE